MDTLPKITIGLPVYNGEKTISKALTNIVNQSYKNLEILISDNCSTDQTEEEVKKFNDPRIKYFKQSMNLGSTGNFDFVLQNASGEYFMWHSHDDWLDLDYIEKCFQKLSNDSELSLVTGQAKYYADGNFIREGHVTQFEQKCSFTRVLSYYSEVTDNGVYYGLMRLNDISKIKLRNVLSGDWMIIAALAFKGKILHFDETFINRELGGTSRSFKNIINSLKLSKFYHIIPFIIISIDAAFDVFRCKLYERLSLLRKSQLALAIFWTINYRIMKRRITNVFKRLAPTKTV